MNVPFYIARRYLFAKKSTNAINIISGVAAAGIAFGTMALILVLSVFNGLEGLVVGLYDTFYPELKVEARVGKVFRFEEAQLTELRQLDGVRAVAPVLEEVAVLQFGENTTIARLKGVDEAFTAYSPIDTALLRGNFDTSADRAVLGLGVELELRVNVPAQMDIFQVYLPKRTAKAGKLNPEEAFNKGGLLAGGTFSIQESFDREYAFVPLDFLRDLLDYERGEVSHLELVLQPGADLQAIQAQVKMIVGEGFNVQNRFEQNEFLYKVMQTEKWAVYLILTLILIVASFNIIGSLSMLVIEKKADIEILRAMGADSRLIRRIFLTEGLLLALSGGLLGMVVAFVICLLQQVFGFVKLQGNNLLLDAYPVEMQWSDFALVFLTLLTVSLLASWWPAARAGRVSE